MELIRLLLVDDYQMETQALAARLSAAQDLWVAGCHRTGDPKLPGIVRSVRPDVLLIDVGQLGPAMPDTLARLWSEWPKMHVVVVSAGVDATQAVDAARLGVAAWVSKDQGVAELESVIRGVCAGESWYPPRLLGEVLRRLRDDVRRVRENVGALTVLSRRERDVLASMAEGKRDRQIADELMISIDTVHAHTRGIFSKLNVHSRLEAVRVARAAGFRVGEQPAQAGWGADAVQARVPNPRTR